MRFILIFSFLTIISSCKSNKTNITTQSKEFSIAKLESDCPSDGNCRIKIEKNKQLLLKSDYIGKLYYELMNDTSKSVVIYEYSRNTPKDLQDASYREEIIFEIPNNTNQIDFIDSELGNLKMLFGRHCFCRGQAGYYPVKQGKINLINENNNIRFSLQFTVNDVPQIINNINNKSPK